MERFDPGELNSSIAMISTTSMGIPSGYDFMFCRNNVTDFASEIKGIDAESEQFLTKIGGLASDLWGIAMVPFGEGFDGLSREAYKWLLNINEVVSRRVDWEIARVQRNEIDVLGQGVASMHVDDVGTKVKVKIPFHIPTIPKPQDQYRIIVNNSNQPFDHVWLARSADGSSVVHPLEDFSAIDFANESVRLSIEPLKYTPIESTSFKFVDDLNDFKAMVAILRRVDEFAVDLEHNQYRSFQGITCLMQISTRTEDFIVDTLKLRVYIGPYLREIFKDPKKRKVMHGADRDILWLQRDFGIYVCNLFDTGQASRVLKMERNTFEHLLKCFCGVTANKEYQTADWRLRPLPEEMLRYAREDTHYLLYIYDLMRMRLLSSAAESEHSDTPLVEVYKRSYDICIQLYAKEILTKTSYLNIYGLQDAGLNAQQLAVVAGLCEWRDSVARAEDESTGYILPNKTLIQIGKEMPLTTSKLWQLVKSKHPYIERNLDTVISIIRRSMLNAHSYRSAAEQLKLRRMEPESAKNPVNIERSDMFPVDSPHISMGQGHLSQDHAYSVGGGQRDSHEGFSESSGDNAHVKNVTDGYDMPKQGHTIHETHRQIDLPHSLGATVQVLMKPSHASRMLLEKFQHDKREPKQLNMEQQIKSVVNLPFHPIVTRGKPAAEELDKQLDFSRGDDDEPVNSNSVTAEAEGGDTTGHPHLTSTFLKYVKPINETRKANLSGKFRGFEGLFTVIAI